MTDMTDIIGKIVSRLTAEGGHPKPLEALLRAAAAEELFPEQLVPDLLIYSVWATASVSLNEDDFNSRFAEVIATMNALGKIAANSINLLPTEH